MKECEGEEETTQGETPGGRGLTGGVGWVEADVPSHCVTLSGPELRLGRQTSTTWAKGDGAPIVMHRVSSEVYTCMHELTFCVCGNTTSLSALTNPSPRTAAICMEISSGGLSEPALQSSR